MAFDFVNLASMIRKIVASGQVASAATNTTVYTVPPNTDVQIASFSLANNNASGNTLVLSVSVVPSGGSADATRVVVPSVTLAAGDTTQVTELVGAYLDAGAQIIVTSSLAAALNYLVTAKVNS